MLIQLLPLRPCCDSGTWLLDVNLQEINFLDGFGSMQGIPLLYVPLEVVMSKYYGESERLLASIFSAGNELPEGAIVFLDEVSALIILTLLLSRWSNVMTFSAV